MIHGVAAGPQLMVNHPDVFWGFVASMYVGNLMLLILNLPLIGLFVSLLRVPYPLLYPTIIVFCIVGVYQVNGSVVDVWIMLIAGVGGYLLRKLGFDIAPVALGLVLAPILALSLRQSLIMSNGDYAIFIQCPIAATLLAIAGVLIVLALWPALTRGRDLRGRLAETAAEAPPQAPGPRDQG